MPQQQMPKDWSPPSNAWQAKFGGSVTEVVIGYYAIQSLQKSDAPFYPWLTENLAMDDGPEHLERGQFVDVRGYHNDVFIGYWAEPARYERWQNTDRFKQWWNASERHTEQYGYWREVIRVPLERMETLFSSENRAGVTATAVTLEGPIREHGYWGGARDRLAISESSMLDSSLPFLTSQVIPESTEGRRLRIRPPQNLCLLRSAQNWTHCRNQERQIYLEKVAPVLRKGMTYLRDNPLETGCCTSRFIRETTPAGDVEEKTFGMVYFLSLAHLELWAKTHPTHLAIYGEFMKMLEQFEFKTDLQLWHEGIIVDSEAAVFEYINCHAETGLIPYFESVSS